MEEQSFGAPVPAHPESGQGQRNKEIVKYSSPSCNSSS